MVKKLLLPVVAVILLMAMVIPGCGGPGPEEPFVPENGAWIGEVIFSINDQYGSVISQMAAGLLDMYAFPIADPTAYAAVQEEEKIQSKLNYGGYRELRFNTYRQDDGTPGVPPYTGNYTTDNNKLNPFANYKIREAMNWLIDRNYIYEEILQQLGYPKWTALGTQFPDHNRYYEGIVGPIETAYAYSFAAAKAVFDTEMPLMGATWNVGEGKWYFNGAPVQIICLIRADLPPNPLQGQYVSDQIELLGFNVVDLIKTGGEASPMWLGATPVKNGDWHVYTGGWSSPSIPRDSASIFSQMYTNIVMPYTVFQILGPQLIEDGFTDLKQACVDLRARNFGSMAAREALFTTALERAMEWSNCIWTVDIAGANIYAADVETAVDLAGGIGDPAWVHTTHKIDPDTGDPVWAPQFKVAVPNMLLYPLNPVEGSAYTYDMFITRRALGDTGVLPDPRDGHYYPLRVESATVDYFQDLPITNEVGWITLNSSATKIAVPDDAWYDWDATAGQWITAGEYKLANPTWDQTANVKTVVTYPADIFDVPLHDGSTLSLADFLMGMIVLYDRGTTGSSIYDDSAAGDLAAFLSAHKGHRIVDVDPLTIETYTNTWYMDADWNVSTWFPTYGTYDWTGFWHMISAGWLLESFPNLGGLTRMAWSASKSDALEIDQMDYTRGATLGNLAAAVAYAKANSFMPYYDLIDSLYDSFGLTGLDAEITERWANLETFAAGNGHYWASNGPYYLKSVNPVAKIVILGRFEDYPDEAGRFFGFLDPLP